MPNHTDLCCQRSFSRRNRQTAAIMHIFLNSFENLKCIKKNLNELNFVFGLTYSLYFKLYSVNTYVNPFTVTKANKGRMTGANNSAKSIMLQTLSSSKACPYGFWRLSTMLFPSHIPTSPKRLEAFINVLLAGHVKALPHHRLDTKPFWFKRKPGSGSVYV